MEATGVIRVLRAKNLPKTDRFSAIDAYIAISQQGREVGKTATVDDNANPTWNQVTFELPCIAMWGLGLTCPISSPP